MKELEYDINYYVIPLSTYMSAICRPFIFTKGRLCQTNHCLLWTLETAFRVLIGGISSAQVPDGKSFTLHLDKVFEGIEQRGKGALEVTDVVSTTADIWTGHNRSYLGMTATGLIPPH